MLVKDFLRLAWRMRRVGRFGGGCGGGDGGGEGDGDGDGDDGRTYCICDRVSFGEMIACDDENCEKEWVSARRHLDCATRAHLDI